MGASVGIDGGIAATFMLVQKCCDDVDCSEGSPAWPGDCSAMFDCGSIFCPPEPVDLHGAPVAFIHAEKNCKSPAPPGMECTCACRCVCNYPSGRVTWLNNAPPPRKPGLAAALDEITFTDDDMKTN